MLAFVIGVVVCMVFMVSVGTRVMTGVGSCHDFGDLDGREEKPKLLTDLNILHEYNFENFKRNFGDVEVYVSQSNSYSTDMDGNIKKMTLNNFCETMNNDNDWYFKTEDEYDFLNIIGIKNKIIKEFDTIIKEFDTIIKQFEDKKLDVLYKDCSFWMGGKGSNTGWHTDMDDLSFLYVTEGKKKIQFISPKYDENMYEKKIFTYGAKWSNIDFKNIDYDKYPKFKDVVVQTFILNSGDCIYIPKNWWHCVENLEATIGITYKIFRKKQQIISNISEFFRKINAKIRGYQIYDMGKIISEKISATELQEMRKLIAANIKID
jgi:hypothetical protein